MAGEMVETDQVGDPTREGQIQGAPASMMQTRIVTAPDGQEWFTPREDDPDARFIVRADPFMRVVRELGGSPIQAFNQYSRLLQTAVDAGAMPGFQRAMDQAYQDGGDDREKDIDRMRELNEKPAMAVEFATREDYDAAVQVAVDAAVALAGADAYARGVAYAEAAANKLLAEADTPVEPTKAEDAPQTGGKNHK